MNNLYNSLINGRAYTKDNGEVVVTPPTALELRAAAALKQIADINENNLLVISQLQQREQESMTYAAFLQQAIDNLLQKVNNLTQEKETYENNQSLRDAGRQASDVGVGSDDVSGSPSTSPGSDTD